MPNSAKTKLGLYREKRDFKKTSEPSGSTAVAASPHLRFVIQKHAATRLHYDLRLEFEGVFKSWAVTRGPSLNPADKRLAVEVEDHPLDYGDFEGTIPKGEYGGGTVLLWDRGFWAPEPGFDPEKALKKGELKFVLAGERLNGSWVLVRLKPRPGENPKRHNWLLIKHKDEYAKARGDVAQEDSSVASGREMGEIAKGSGAKPKPFMLKKATAKDAVWHSNRGDAAEKTTTKKTASAKKAPSTKTTAATIANPNTTSKTSARKPAAKTKSAASAKAAARPKVLRQSKMPGFVEPQLCRLADEAPSGAGWAHEIKLDGYRVQIRVQDGEAVLYTRKGLDWTNKFKTIARAAQRLPDCILDGEVVALDDKEAPSFALLQEALSTGDSSRLIYFAFDALWADGDDLRAMPLANRKERLQVLLKKTSSALHYTSHMETHGDSILKAACSMSLEGIVSKRLDAAYRSGRSDAWVKTKCRAGQEVVLGGWTHNNGKFRSLLAGVNRDGKLAYVGRIGTGYGGSVVSRLLPELKAAASKTSPFEGPNSPRNSSDIYWLKPNLVAEIEFAGWTGDNMIRQASFKGLREDKPPAEISIEKTQTVTTHSKTKAAKTAAMKSMGAKAGAVRSSANAQILGVAISHPDKILWPKTDNTSAITKLALAEYYEIAGPRMIEHLRGRPCSLVRTPDGIAGQTFFQRHVMKGMADSITEVKISGDKEPYVQFDSVEALIAAAQTAAVELHPWNCQPGDPETPGRLVFDLDPAPDVSFEDVIEGAKEVRDRLQAVGLEAFCKTTGGKGLHVVTPLKRTKANLEWPEAKSFAHEICRQMAADSPGRYLIKMAKKDRAGRIFLDYLRNDRTSTAVAPYSPRARNGATVSMPIAWSQVRKGLTPARYTIETAPALLKKSDPWADYCDAERPFTPAAKKLLAKRR